MNLTNPPPDILRAARLATEFRAGCEREAFENDEKTQSAVLHQLLVLGEAVKRLSDAFRERHPGVPWQQIAGMRNWIIHQYADVDPDEPYCRTTCRKGRTRVVPPEPPHDAPARPHP